MKKFILPAIFGIAILTGCEKIQKEKVDTSEQQTKTEQIATKQDAAHDEHTNSAANLELDNGKKWKTNTEMLPYIQEQERLIEAYDSETGDYKKLAADLTSANEKLIKSCTMSGKSHEVLHVWLAEHMKKIDMLAKSANKEETEKLAESLEHSMKTYHQYFD